MHPPVVAFPSLRHKVKNEVERIGYRQRCAPRFKESTLTEHDICLKHRTDERIEHCVRSEPISGSMTRIEKSALESVSLRFLDPHQYQPEVTQLFEVIANEVCRLLPRARVEHIGASAIPGAISKGDLDVFVGVDEKELERTVDCLERNGYRVKPDTLRNESLCMLETCSYEVPVALQVVASGSEYEMFLTFRDAVKRSECLLEEYNQMKHLCEGMSEESYRIRKSEFIEYVLESLRK